MKSLQVQHVRMWLNSTAKTCQCCAQGKDAKRVEKQKERCCAKGECCEDYPALPSLRYLLRLLRAALQNAVDEDLISRNVAKRMKPPKGADRKVTPWDAQEAKTFLKAVEDHRLYGLWAVGLGIGLRKGEALGLRWRDVDLEGGYVDIRQTLHRVDGELRLDEVKTESSAASVPLPKPLIAILRRHKRMQSAERLAAGEEWEDHDLVFTTQLGRPLEPRNVNRSFGALCKEAGVRPIRMHDLRHSCATLLFTLGVDAATVQRILRHSSISVTTGTYVEVLNSVQHEAVSKLNGLFA